MRDFSEFLPLPVLCLSVVHLYLIVFLFFSSSAVMIVRIGPKLKAPAADVQRMLFTTSEPQVQPLRHVIFKDLPRLPFVMQDQMVDFRVYIKKTSHL